MPQTILSLAKTTQPTLSMVVDRTALFARIEEFADKHCIWIQAPAGAGKTTLVASYIQARRSVALWYQLDSADADVSSFMYFLRRTALKHRAEATVALPEPPMNPGDWSAYARRLFRAIFQRYEGQLVIVLDNYESIPPHSGLHALLALALEEVPRQGKLMCVSRAEPPASFARARANNLLASIGADELRLTPEECRQLAQLRRAELSPEDVELIFQTSAGWITGAILMLEYARPAKRLGRSAFQADGGVLYDYVALEVFSGFDERTRRFLLNVCWPRRLSVMIAESLGADGMARQLLINLSRNNYFVAERDDGDTCEFTLHPLLREFLQIQARKTMPESAVAAQLRRSAELLAQAGHPDEAVELLTDAMEWDALEAVIGIHAKALLLQGRHTVLAGWLEQLPRDRLQRNLPLLCWFGQARLRESPREARQCFETVCRQLPGTAPVADRLRALAGAVESILAEMDDFSLLDGLITGLAALLPAPMAPNGDPDRLTAAVQLIVAIAVRDPARTDLQERLRHAEQAVREMPAGVEQEKLLQWLILAYVLTGEFSRAGVLLEECRSRATGMREEQQCRLLLLSALQHLLSGSGPATRKAGTECLRLAQEQSQHRLVALARACTAALELGANGGVAAARMIAALESALADDPNRLLRFLSYYLSSWRDLVAGDHVTAHHRQRQALSCAVELGIPFLEVLSSCAYAQLLFLCDDQRAGSAQLRRVHSVARDMRNPFLEFITLLIYGQVAILNGRISSGANAMRYALGLGRQHAYYFVPWWHPGHLTDALVLAFRQDIERDYVRDFVQRRGLKAGTAPVDLPDWPWALHIRTFGGLKVSLGNGGGEDSGRGNARPLQLLKALIALGARDVSAAQMAGLLWPHVDSMYSEKSLTINLHRLRKMLADDDAILLCDGKLSLNADLAYVDTVALGRIAGLIRTTAPRPAGAGESSNSLEEQAEHLLDVYRGPFLGADDELECVGARRDQCRAEFEGAVLALAEELSLTDMPQAMSLYERAINNDPAAEGLYRGLMSLYSRVGRSAEAVSVYQRCCTALATISRRSPSAETISAHTALAGRV